MKSYLMKTNPRRFAADLERARALLSAKGDAEVTLSLAGGQYRLSSPVVLDGRDLVGKKHLRLVGGEKIKTVFSSLVPLDASRFAPVAGKPYYACRMERDASGEYPLVRALYVDGQIAPISRTATYKTYLAPKHPDGSWNVIMQDKWTEEHGDRLYVPLAAIEEAGAESCRGAEMHLRVEWEFKIYHIDHADLTDTFTAENGVTYAALQLDRSEKKYGNKILHICDRAFFIAGTPAVLTEKGEYAYDRGTGTLYYYPKKPIEKCRFALGGTTHLFRFEDMTGITLRGLTFTGVEDEIFAAHGYFTGGQAGNWECFPEKSPNAGVVKLRNVADLLVEDCTFTDLPCDGISALGTLKNAKIANCRFTNIGASAIRIGHPIIAYAPERLASDVTIEDNEIINTGFTYQNACALIVTKLKNGRINHNTILRSSYTAISVGWKWDSAYWTFGEEVNLQNVEIAHNYIKAFMTNMRDGGGIYTLGGNARVHDEIFLNFMHDNVIIEDETTCPENGFFASLYHDGASSHWYDYNNIVVHYPPLDAPYSARIYLQQLGGTKPFTASQDGQSVWNIFCENNFVTGCEHYGRVFASYTFDPERATNRFDYTRRVRERGTHLLSSPEELEKYPTAVYTLRTAGVRKKEN